MTLRRRLDILVKDPSYALREATLRGSLRLYEHAPVRRTVGRLAAHRQPDRWAFIMGCYNSGTTLLWDLLGAHPEIGRLPKEGVQLTPELTRPEDHGWTRMWVRCEEHVSLPAEPDPEKARRLQRDWAPWWPRGARVYIEKSIANVPRMRWFDRNFPGARFIGITRNGFCAAEGIQRRAAPRGAARQSYGAERYSIDMAGQQWVTANERMLEHAESVGSFKLTSYEALMARPEEVLGELFTYLGCDPAAAEMHTDADGRFHLGGRVFDLRNRNESSLARLSEAEKATLRPVLKPTMEKLGYTV